MKVPDIFLIVLTRDVWLRKLRRWRLLLSGQEKCQDSERMSIIFQSREWRLRTAYGKDVLGKHTHAREAQEKQKTYDMYTEQLHPTCREILGCSFGVLSRNKKSVKSQEQSWECSGIDG